MKSSKSFTLLICVPPNYLTSIAYRTFQSCLVFALCEHCNWPSAKTAAISKKNLTLEFRHKWSDDAVMAGSKNKFLFKYTTCAIAHTPTVIFNSITMAKAYGIGRKKLKKANISG